MTEEDKQLFLKDLCARLPYKVKIQSWYGEIITSDLNTFPLSMEEMDKEDMWDQLSGFKPYLRPLFSMTKEEAKDIATLMGIKDIISINITEKYIDVIKDDGFCSTETITIWFNEIVSSIEIFDYLNVHCFDYRDLIPMGLAIEVTEENNPYKENDTRR